MRRSPVEVSLVQLQAKYRYFAQQREAAKLAISNKLDPLELWIKYFRSFEFVQISISTCRIFRASE